MPSYEGTYSVFKNWGRVARDAKKGVEKIVEFKDAFEDERSIREVNLNYYCFDAGWLWQNIGSLKTK